MRCAARTEKGAALALRLCDFVAKFEHKEICLLQTIEKGSIAFGDLTIQ
jgi:hypothetical protein